MWVEPKKKKKNFLSSIGPSQHIIIHINIKKNYH